MQYSTRLHFFAGRACPLTLELEHVNSFTDVCIAPYNVDATANPGVVSRFPVADTSVLWSIEQVEVKCDRVL